MNGAWGYRENEPLDGYRPLLQQHKSCSELVTHSYKNIFFYGPGDVAISTARAGNVIGGGDFANDRIIPDCVRAMKEKRESIGVRNPVFHPAHTSMCWNQLAVYLLIAQAPV